MISFSKLWNQIDENKSPLVENNQKVLDVVRTGKNLRNSEDPKFWDDFIRLCNNTDGIAELFGVNPQTVIGWPAKIRQALDQLQKTDAENPLIKDKKEQFPTGNTGAFVDNS